MRACQAAGLKIAVASSADMVKVNANLRAAGLHDVTFDAIVAADAFERLKPAPDIFLEASRQLGVPPAACVVIEDAAAGVQAARAAGMWMTRGCSCIPRSCMEECCCCRCSLGTWQPEFHTGISTPSPCASYQPRPNVLPAYITHNTTHTGMRCIAVTTTLDEQTMTAESPSLVRPSIAEIRLSDIQTLPAGAASPATPLVAPQDTSVCGDATVSVVCSLQCLSFVLVCQHVKNTACQHLVSQYSNAMIWCTEGINTGISAQWGGSERHSAATWWVPHH